MLVLWGDMFNEHCSCLKHSRSIQSIRHAVYYALNSMNFIWTFECVRNGSILYIDEFVPKINYCIMVICKLIVPTKSHFMLIALCIIRWWFNAVYQCDVEQFNTLHISSTHFYTYFHTYCVCVYTVDIIHIFYDSISLPTHTHTSHS
jgi:hypothetical protein